MKKLIYVIIGIILGLFMFTEVFMNTFTAWDNRKTTNSVYIVQ